MKIELNEHELSLVHEWIELRNNITMDTPMKRINELRQLITGKIAGKVEATELLEGIAE